MTNASNKLDVVRILLSALLAPIVHRRRLVRFAIPLIAIELLSLLQDRFASDSSPAGILGSIALGIASGGAWLLLAVASHRIFILGEQSTAGWGFLWWTSRETRFLGWAILIGFIGAFLFLPGLLLLQWSASSDPGQSFLAAYVFMLPAMYVVLRLSLVLPATAADKRHDIGWAWQISRGNGIRLMLAILFLPLCFQLLLESLPASESLIFQSIVAVVGIYISLVDIAALSTSYRELAKHRSVSGGAAAVVD